MPTTIFGNTHNLPHEEWFGHFSPSHLGVVTTSRSFEDGQAADFTLPDGSHVNEVGRQWQQKNTHGIRKPWFCAGESSISGL